MTPYRNELELAVLNHDVMPSMRALMTAGPAAKKNHVALYNCLGGETLVTTLEYGIVPIKDVAGKSVHIVDGDGNWTLSSCKSYGFADLYKINLATSGTGTFSFRATANHRWLDENNNVIYTSDLKNGVLLANTSMPKRISIDETTEDYKKGVIHGIIYGDGTATFKGNGKTSKDLYTDKICNSFVIRLCGKSKELISYFENYQRSYPKTYNGDPVVRIHDAVFDLKSLPEDWVTDDYRLGFIRGWYAADGSVTSKTHQVSLASTEEGMSWIYKFGPRYGFVPLNNSKYPNETNYGKRKRELYRIEFDRRWLHEDDIILNYKKILFVPVSRRNGKVISVEYSNNEEVFCFEVPTTQSFLLTKNILTGNCAYLPMDDIKSFDEEMAILMSGTGVGYSVETDYVKQLPELPDEFFESDTTIIFDDSRLGWAKGYREFLSLLLIGQIPKWDVSKLRLAGARLKTMGGRCLSGDTIVYKDRKVDRGYNEITLSKLFDLQTNYPHRFKQIKLRSLDEESGEFFRNELKTVIYNGNRMTYNLVTAKGYRIKATENHRFMNELGDYQFLSDFDVGDKIAVNGSSERKTGICVNCGDNVSRRAIRCKECNRISQFKDDCRDTTSRQRLEVKRYKANNPFCEICGIENVEFECHHVDGNPWNNKENNLQNLCISCHREEDMKRIYFGNPYACKYMMYDEIIEISEAGEEEVYDLEMEGPNHNFIANGFISHNSSGPEPLVDLLRFTINIFKKAAGRKLTTLEAHDIACKVADIVVVGGVRRSALISLSDLNDERMRDAKSGNWWMTNPYRRLANNSAVYNEKPDIGIFMKEWLSLYESHSGERGIISRKALKRVIENANEFRKDSLADFKLRYRETNHKFGVNPCAEIILRPYEFCNLTSVQVYEDDTPETIKNKIRLATILGTFQSTFTNFKYLNKKWQKNCDDERLLGVSLNGIFDNKYTNGKDFFQYEAECPEVQFQWFLEDLKKEAIITNIDFAEKLGINSSVAITCVKPEGCLSLDTKIKTTEGIKSIASIFGELTSYDIFEMDGGNWITPDRKMYVYDENNEEKEITKLYVNGLSEVYEIIMEDNTIVKLTANHQLKTIDGWKKAKDLSENDDILSW